MLTRLVPVSPPNGAGGFGPCHAVPVGAATPVCGVYTTTATGAVALGGPPAHSTSLPMAG